MPTWIIFLFMDGSAMCEKYHIFYLVRDIQVCFTALYSTSLVNYTF